SHVDLRHAAAARVRPVVICIPICRPGEYRDLGGSADPAERPGLDDGGTDHNGSRDPPGPLGCQETSRADRASVRESGPFMAGVGVSSANLCAPGGAIVTSSGLSDTPVSTWSIDARSALRAGSGTGSANLLLAEWRHRNDR